MKRMKRWLLVAWGIVTAVALGALAFLGMRQRKLNYVSDREWTAASTAALEKDLAALEISDHERNRKTHEAVERDAGGCSVNDTLAAIRRDQGG